MSVSSLPFLKPHFHNNSGSLATGYKLYSYDSTTQDAIPLYKDPAGSIEYTNPLILNSRGEPDGMGIYLDDDKTYKIVLKTENDTPVWTINAVKGVAGSGSGSVPVINLPGHTVLGNASDDYDIAYAVEIVDTITSTTDEDLIPSVGAINIALDGYLPNSGNNTYNGNLTVAGEINASNISVDGTDIDDIYVAKNGHTGRTVVGNIDETTGAVEDIPIVNSLDSGSVNEIPSVGAVKNYVDSEVADLEEQIEAIEPDGKVKVSATDIANYFENKCVQGNRVQITKIVDGGEEKLQWDLNLDDLKDISYVFQAYGDIAGFDDVVNGEIYAQYISDPVNFNDAFDVDTGRFTCAESGYYHFDASALIDQTGSVNASTCNFYLAHYDSSDVLQSQTIGFATTPASASSHANFTLAVAANFHLNVGDYVGIVFTIADTALRVNKVAFGGYSLDSANAAAVSGTPNRLAVYDTNGNLNPAQRLVYDGLYNLLLGYNTTVGTNIAEGVAIGRDNSIDSQDSVAIGRQNSITGGSSFGLAYAFGRSNTVNAPESMAVGIRNNAGVTSAGETMVVGLESTVDGSEMLGIGQDLDVDGADSTVIGQDITGSNLVRMVAVGNNIQLTGTSNAKMIVGKNFNEALIPVGSPATSVFGTTNNEFISVFGKYVDQFGNIGLRGRFLGFDADNKLKVTNEVSDIQFITTADVTPVEGQLAWNDLDKTLNVGLAGGSILQVGEEELVYAVNKTGSTINNGEVVYVSGSQGNRIIVSLAQAVTTATNQVFIAVATQNINNNQTGYFTRFGLVRDINTAAYLEGDILWVSTTAGQLTSVQPSKPYSQIAVAIVTRAHAVNGTIMVSPYVVPRLGQLTDVTTTGATDGQALVYNATTGIWEPGDATGGVSDGKVKVTSGDTADYLGVKFTSSDNSVSIDVDTGSIDLTVDVGTIESSFSTNPISTSVSGTVPFSALEFGNWTISNGELIAPADISGVHQINLIGKILYSNELDGSQAFYADYGGSSFYNGTNQIISWNSMPFGNWNDDNNRVTILESGKLQINWSYVLQQTTTAGIIASMTVYHYASNGTLKELYLLNGKLTDLLYASTYEAYNRSHVLDVTGGDYLQVNISVNGTGYVSDLCFSGGLLSNVNDTARNTTPIFLNHKSSSGVVKSSIVAYEGVSVVDGFRSFAISKTYELEEGDRFYVTVYPASNINAITDIILSGAMTQCNSVQSGSSDPTLDGAQTYALIMTNGSISTGHTSDQGSTYTSARIIPTAQVESNYISCFATQIGTFYGLRMGIYTPGPSGDTLIAQTANLTTTPSSGVITLPILYDAAGNALSSPIVLQPNTSYMLAAVIKSNACNFASYTGISTNPPNHFGRKDDWNAPAPTNLMQTTASYSQTNQFIWMSVSK